MRRRVGKKKNGALLKQWVYRDALKPAAELDGAGNLVSQFVYGSKRNVPDYVRRGGATFRVVSDHLGSPRYVVNVTDAGDVPFAASYSSFGEITGTGLDWMPFGFAGGIHDEETGVTRFGARDYLPDVGRWSSKDPLRFNSGDVPNLYVYSNGDPVNSADPSGLQTPPPWFWTIPFWDGPEPGPADAVFAAALICYAAIESVKPAPVIPIYEDCEFFHEDALGCYYRCPSDGYPFMKEKNMYGNCDKNPVRRKVPR
jgi:RHS repeat-associated protein